MSHAWRMALTVPAAATEAFAELIADQADAVATFEIEEDGEFWLVEGTAACAPDLSRLTTRIAVLAAALGLPEPPLSVEPLPALDWVTRSYQGFPPLRAGRFFLRGSHVTEPSPASAWVLTIDAATAFGTGEHGSTRGCLLAIDRLTRLGRRGLPGRRGALDMGCGSGVLALAVARAWHRPAIAVDLDPEAVRVTRTNAVLNRLDRLIRTGGGDGYHAAVLRRSGRFPLILSNILARPLARMAPALAARLAPGGYAVLAGLLRRQESLVLRAHRRHGLFLVRRIEIGEWTTLVLRRRPRSIAP
ncbi:MAG: methyltransferase [Azospirillum sp.]|nr:methyltransferase [Azospirillum sp.]